MIDLTYWLTSTEVAGIEVSLRNKLTKVLCDYYNKVKKLENDINLSTLDYQNTISNLSQKIQAQATKLQEKDLHILKIKTKLNQKIIKKNLICNQEKELEEESKEIGTESKLDTSKVSLQMPRYKFSKRYILLKKKINVLSAKNVESARKIKGLESQVSFFLNNSELSKKELLETVADLVSKVSDLQSQNDEISSKSIKNLSEELEILRKNEKEYQNFVYEKSNEILGISTKITQLEAENGVLNQYKAKYDSLSKEFIRVNTLYNELKTGGLQGESKNSTTQLTIKKLENAQANALNLIEKLNKSADLILKNIQSGLGNTNNSSSTYETYDSTNVSNKSASTSGTNDLNNPSSNVSNNFTSTYGTNNSNNVNNHAASSYGTYDSMNVSNNSTSTHEALDSANLSNHPVSNSGTYASSNVNNNSASSHGAYDSTNVSNISTPSYGTYDSNNVNNTSAASSSVYDSTHVSNNFTASYATYDSNNANNTSAAANGAYTSTPSYGTYDSTNVNNTSAAASGAYTSTPSYGTYDSTNVNNNSASSHGAYDSTNVSNISTPSYGTYDSNNVNNTSAAASGAYTSTPSYGAYDSANVNYNSHNTCNNLNNDNANPVSNNVNSCTVVENNSPTSINSTNAGSSNSTNNNSFINNNSVGTGTFDNNNPFLMYYSDPAMFNSTNASTSFNHTNSSLPKMPFGMNGSFAQEFLKNLDSRIDQANEGKYNPLKNPNSIAYMINRDIPAIYEGLSNANIALYRFTDHSVKIKSFINSLFSEMKTKDDLIREQQDVIVAAEMKYPPLKENMEIEAKLKELDQLKNENQILKDAFGFKSSLSPLVKELDRLKAKNNELSAYKNKLEIRIGDLNVYIDSLENELKDYETGQVREPEIKEEVEPKKQRDSDSDSSSSNRSLDSDDSEESESKSTLRNKLFAARDEMLFYKNELNIVEQELVQCQDTMFSKNEFEVLKENILKKNEIIDCLYTLVKKYRQVKDVLI